MFGLRLTGAPSKGTYGGACPSIGGGFGWFGGSFSAGSTYEKFLNCSSTVRRCRSFSRSQISNSSAVSASVPCSLGRTLGRTKTVSLVLPFVLLVEAIRSESTGGVEVAGSNPVSPTDKSSEKHGFSRGFSCFTTSRKASSKLLLLS